MYFPRFSVILSVALLLCPAVVSARTEEVTIQGSVGRLSAVVQWPDRPEKGKIPVAIIMHGFTGEKNAWMLRLLADSLERRGVASVRFDFNAHGESEGEFQNMTVLNEIEDALCVFRYVQGLSRAGRIGLVGHSQGGVVASMVAGRLGRQVSSVVLLAPAAVLRDDAIRGNTMGAVYDPLNPPEYVNVGNHRLGREFIRTAFSLPIYETASRYHGRASVIHGTGDRIAPYTYGIRYHEIWKHSRLYLLDGFDHGFSQGLERAIGLAARDTAHNLGKR